MAKKRLESPPEVLVREDRLNPGGRSGKEPEVVAAVVSQERTGQGREINQRRTSFQVSTRLASVSIIAVDQRTGRVEPLVISQPLG